MDNQDFKMIKTFKQTYIDALKQYYFIGGMPEAVQYFAKYKDFNEVRNIQKKNPDGLRTRFFQICTKCKG